MNKNEKCLKRHDLTTQVLKMTKAGDENKLTAEMTRKYISIEVTKDEFADYFNMKPDNLFVNQMFNTADIDGSGSISFREFLDIMILFTKGLNLVRFTNCI